MKYSLSKMMKIFYTLTLILCCYHMHASDTLRPVSYADTCARKFVPNVGVVPDLVSYIALPPFSGFICGTNSLKSPEKAQKYYGTDTARTLTDIAFWFGQKIQSSSPGQIKGKVYSVHPIKGSPDILLGESMPLPVDSIKTTNILTVVSFTAPLNLPDSFFVALDLTLLSPGDSVALLSTKDSCFSGEQLAWELDSNGVWNPFNDGTIVSSWGLNIDMAIFPVGDFGLNTFIQPKQTPAHDFNFFPNPARDFIYWNCNTCRAKKTEVLMYDMQGRLVFSKTTNEFENEIEFSNLKNGMYLIRFISGNRQFYSRLMIQH